VKWDIYSKFGVIMLLFGVKTLSLKGDTKPKIENRPFITPQNFEN
jgi:hypothetical protein